MERVNPSKYKGWNEILQNSPDSYIFHTENWAAVLAKTYNYSPHYFVEEGTGKFEFLLPVMEVQSWITGRRGVCLPFSDLCYPLTGESTKFLEKFSHIVNVTQENHWKYLEVRGGKALQDIAQSSSSFCLHTLKLQTNTENVYTGFRSNYRSKIKKATESGVTVDMLYSREAMKSYYRLHCITRRRHGLPPQPMRFFNNIFEHIIAQNLGFIILASYKQEIIAGAVFFLWGQKAVYKFGASDSKFEKLNANHLLFWHAIRWLCEHHYSEVSFGRTGTENTGLIQFKEGWGAEREQLDYYKYNYSSRSFMTGNQDSGEKGYSFFRKMPTPLLVTIGSLLYRHVG